MSNKQPKAGNEQDSNPSTTSTDDVNVTQNQIQNFCLRRTPNMGVDDVCNQPEYQQSTSSSSDTTRSGSSAQLQYMKAANDVRKINKGLQNAQVNLEVKNLMIVTKLNDLFLVYLTRELVEWLLKNFPSINVYVEETLKDDPKFNTEGIYKDAKCIENKIFFWTPQFVKQHNLFFDMVITMGGDGTVLYVSTIFQQSVPPVLSFSLGSLGFLTNFKFENFKEDLPRILNHKIKSSLRMRLQCTVYRNKSNDNSIDLSEDSSTISPPLATVPFELKSSSTDQTMTIFSIHHVLNEITIDRGPGPFLTNLEIYGDDFFMTNAQGDGLIVATPTGSTAYSLSAGGSLVCPTVNAIALTPICPHTLSFRPIILPDSVCLKIKVSMKSRGSAWASFDGKSRTELRPGDYVKISCSSFSFPTVSSTDEQFIRNISRTLNWNVREQQKSFTNLLSSKNKKNFVKENKAKKEADELESSSSDEIEIQIKDKNKKKAVNK
ncbi:similar to Saccharomyces cerevisiae YEL041W YEF1 ATP-NADH kinase [Maudiozyma saulgeensis]|uniref:Similar to Saccharomyces cerevisiae YEL041W YEF1 ATP-NADH kinase n=1 Tax=Maudiozyma saulgeensis TaxID=1789683 RepID=A0A1X7R1I4_9SACH|nr:similar to Saccharomyces cerevisiae YEL041W YEF1 ATP-NADH kinase [Kazachstania saulgeensis]